jgi:hypothetical protein
VERRNLANPRSQLWSTYYLRRRRKLLKQVTRVNCPRRCKNREILRDSPISQLRSRSVVTTMGDASTSEVGTLGREGVTSGPASLRRIARSNQGLYADRCHRCRMEFGVLQRLFMSTRRCAEGSARYNRCRAYANGKSINAFKVPRSFSSVLACLSSDLCIQNLM